MPTSKQDFLYSDDNWAKLVEFGKAVADPTFAEEAFYPPPPEFQENDNCIRKKRQYCKERLEVVPDTDCCPDVLNSFCQNYAVDFCSCEECIIADSLEEQFVQLCKCLPVSDVQSL